MATKYITYVKSELKKEDEAIVVRRIYKRNILALSNLSISPLLEKAEP